MSRDEDTEISELLMLLVRMRDPISGILHLDNEQTNRLLSWIRALEYQISAQIKLLKELHHMTGDNADT